MAKSKPETNGKAAKVAPATKDAGVKKSMQKPAVKAKELAKATAAKALPRTKKAEPASEDSDSESGSDISESVASSDASSDSDASEDETSIPASKTNGAKINGAKTNGVKAAAEDSSDDSEESDSDEEEAAPQAKAGAAGAAAAVAASDDEDTSDESESSDDDDAPSKTNGAAKTEEDSEEDEDSSDESDEEEEAPTQKRKAEAVSTPASKKVKTDAVTPGEGDGVKNLFVGGLSWNIDEEWLAREFEEFGEIVGARIITDRESGRSKGYGYVEFAEAEAASNALKAKHETMIDGRNIRVDFSTPRQPRDDAGTPRDRAPRANRFGDSIGNPTDTLFCGNLSFDCTSEAVSEAFGEFGTITSVRLPTDRETGAPKGFGYISFATVDEAKAALDSMNGQEVAGRRCRLDYAQPRDQNGGGRGGRGGFGDRGGRGGRGGFGDRGRGGFGGRGGARGGSRGGRGGSTNRGGFGDFKGNKVSFD